MTSFSELVALLTTVAITWKGIIIVFIIVVMFAVFRVFGLLFGVCSEKIKFLLSSLKNCLFAFVTRFFAAISRQEEMRYV